MVNNLSFKQNTIMKVFAVLLFLNQMAFISCAFDVFQSMEDTRDTLMSFYDPIHVKTQTAQSTSAKPTITVGSLSVSSLKPKRVLKIKSKSSIAGGVGPKGMKGMPGPPGIFLSKLRRYKPRARVSTKRKSTSHLTPKVTQKLKTIKKKRISLNKFSEAMKDIEKALADAQLGRFAHNEKRLRKLQNLIKTALLKRSYRFARKAIGEAIFTIKKLNQNRKLNGRGKRSVVLSPKKFLLNLKQKLGASDFNNLLAMHGQVTLMFAIDDTASMFKKIDAAKKIATAIVKENRSEPVDYILSPFNDPDTGPVTYCNETEQDKFLKAISSLKPHDGGDCRELTFAGMKDAIDVGGPQPDSPLYVFTDAGPKDANEESVTYLKNIIQDEGVVVNFFIVKDSSCSKRADVSSLHEIAEASNGQVFELKDEKELEDMGGLTAASLGGTAVVTSVKHKTATRKKRSSIKQKNNHTITVDDSIDTLVISMTADLTEWQNAGGNSWSATLTSPTGSLAGVSTKNLNQGTIYEISNPSVGIWDLGIQSNLDMNYDVSVKATSADNIDFEFYFIRTTSRRRVKTTIPINSPIKGEKAEAVLTLGGVNHIDATTLKAELVTLNGDVIKGNQPKSLTAKDRKGIRYIFAFYPPNKLFKIKLKGKTKKGNTFERISHTPIKSQTLLVKVLYARNDFTVKQGGTGYVIFKIENFANDETVNMKTFLNMGSIVRQSRKFGRIRKGRRTSFSVTFRGNSKAIRGVTITIVVSVIGRSSGSLATMSVPLLVV